MKWVRDPRLVSLSTNNLLSLLLDQPFLGFNAGQLENKLMMAFNSSKLTVGFAEELCYFKSTKYVPTHGIF